MGTQKEEVLKFVNEQRDQGGRVGEALKNLGVKRSSYYRWRKGGGEAGDPVTNRSVLTLTPMEIERIDRVKEENPGLRHRVLQGILQAEGLYVSATAIYRRLKGLGQVEPYARRPSPLKVPRYEIWQRNLVWGSDWTKLLVGGIRWYLLTVIDFFSRLIVAWRVIPSVNASHIKEIYQAGLKGQGFSLKSEGKPEMHVDRGSPNTSWVTREFFEIIGAELSFARVRRPTDNAVTERFYGTIKQEEIYVVGNYPDEISANEEIGKYIDYYNQKRPHQALWNFAPAKVHEINNKTVLLKSLEEIKRKTREKRKLYWKKHQESDSQKIVILSH